MQRHLLTSDVIVAVRCMQSCVTSSRDIPLPLSHKHSSSYVWLTHKLLCCR